MKTTILWCFAVVAVLLYGCGGGGGSGGTAGVGSTAVKGLEVASEMSLVEAKSVTSASINLKGNVNGIRALVQKAITSDSATAYYTDPLNVYVFDESMESLNIINEILCSMDQTQYDVMVNEGAYLALIDNAACDKDGNKSSSQGNQSSGSNQEDLEIWTVNSTRADDNADHIVKVWIDQAATEFEPAAQIQAKVTITAAVSDDKPFGAFHLDFKMIDPSSGSTLANGYLETVDRTDGKVEFQFSMSGSSGFNVNEATHVVMTADGSAGNAYTSHSFKGDGFEESGVFEVAYDASHYLSSKTGGESKCLDRNNFDKRVFQYGVYKSDGSRLDVANPGFGIKYTTGGKDYYGWAGYWGIWLPEDISLSGGETVTRTNHDSSSGQQYTTVIAPGKLKKHTKKSLTLSDIDGDDLRYWQQESGQTVRVHWSNSTDAFIKDAVEIFGASGPSWQEVTASNLSLSPNNWVSFWRDGLGSINLVVPSNGQLTDSTAITSDEEEVLTAAHSDFSSGSLTLLCFDQCLKANITSDQLNWSNGATPFQTDAASISSPYSYTISTTDMTLKDSNGNAVKLATGAAASSGSPNSWGVGSGAMVTSTSGMTNTWDVWSQPTYYTWETGPNQWNKFTGVKDSNGTMVKFDPPKHLNYTHTSTGDKYFLEYSAFGELHGLPWIEDASGRWYPQITISDGATATDSDGTTYYIRALDMEQSMQSVATSNCSSLSLSSTPAAPTGTAADPDIGDEPTITDDPAVIKGEVIATTS